MLTNRPNHFLKRQDYLYKCDLRWWIVTFYQLLIFITQIHWIFELSFIILVPHLKSGFRKKLSWPSIKRDSKFKMLGLLFRKSLSMHLVLRAQCWTTESPNDAAVPFTQVCYYDFNFFTSRGCKFQVLRFCLDLGCWWRIGALKNAAQNWLNISKKIFDYLLICNL